MVFPFRDPHVAPPDGVKWKMGPTLLGLPYLPAPLNPKLALCQLHPPSPSTAALSYGRPGRLSKGEGVMVLGVEVNWKVLLAQRSLQCRCVRCVVPYEKILIVCANVFFEIGPPPDAPSRDHSVGAPSASEGDPHWQLQRHKSNFHISVTLGKAQKSARIIEFIGGLHLRRHTAMQQLNSRHPCCLAGSALGGLTRAVAGDSRESGARCHLPRCF